MNEKSLIGGLVVTHGRIGSELLAAVEMIVGEVTHILAVSIGWHDDVNQSRLEIEQAVLQVEQGKGVIILTDMFGGSPSNISLALLKKGELEIVTGVNLPMMIKLANQSGSETLNELAISIREQGQKHISIASHLLGE